MISAKRARNPTTTTGGLPASTQTPAWPKVAAYAVCGLAVVQLFLSVRGDQRFEIPTLALVALLPPLAAIAHSQRGALSYWTPALLSVAIGITARSYAISFDHSTAPELQQLLPLGASPQNHFHPLLASLACLAAIALGAISQERSRLAATEAPGIWQPLGAARASALTTFSLLGLVGLVGYVRSTGGFDLSRLSAKRDVIVDLDAGLTSTAGSASLWRLIASISSLSLFYFIARNTPRPLPPRQLLASGGMLLLAVAGPFYSSQRGEALAVLITCAVLLGLSKRRLPLRATLASVACILLLFNAMTTLRQAAQQSRAETLSSLASLEPTSELVDAILVNRSFLDLGKTAEIIEESNGEGQLGRAYGSTIFSYVIAPIPRAIWPDKPLIAPGPRVGAIIYDSRSGVPPGMIAELIWNFGIATALALCFAIGAGLQRAERLLLGQADGIRGLVLYAAVFYPLLGRLLGGAIGGTLLNSAVLGISWIAFTAALDRIR